MTPATPAVSRPATAARERVEVRVLAFIGRSSLLVAACPLWAPADEVKGRPWRLQSAERRAERALAASVSAAPRRAALSGRTALTHPGRPARRHPSERPPNEALLQRCG